jgi:hypothetical protein
MLVKGRPILKTEIGQWAWSGAKVGEQTVLLRPDAVTLNGTEPCHLRGKVRTRSFRGSMCRAVITIENTPLTFDFPSRANLPAEGAEVDLAFDPEQALQAWQ